MTAHDQLIFVPLAYGASVAVVGDGHGASGAVPTADPRDFAGAAGGRAAAISAQHAASACVDKARPAVGVLHGEGVEYSVGGAVVGLGSVP